MRYVEARIDEYNREEAYRIFVTESLRLAPQNRYVSKSYTEILNPKKQDTRTGAEIAMDVLRKAGLKMGD